jgi:pantoate--beta-alanine ligase
MKSTPDENAKKTTYNFGNLGKVMEGKHRPGHFDGVAMVVKRLFEIVQPNKAFFGQKDIQQYLIIRHLNDNYLKHLNIKVIKCPIVREDDGLAMSSRNVLLSNEHRNSAALISRTLFEARKNYSNYSVGELINWATNKINSDKNLEVEYFEVAKDPDLTQISNWNEADKILACVAVNAGNVRLIDNIYLK